MKVTVFDASGETELSASEFAVQLGALERPHAQPFSDLSLAALSDLSTIFMQSPLRHGAPQMVALGFWLRPAAIAQIQKQHFRPDANVRVVPRGLALHLPPANVDTLFVYSWAISFLLGNSNIVRLPSQMSPVARALVQSICEVLAKHGLQQDQVFCSYSKSSDVGAKISAMVDLRVIWGGDEKVRTVSADPILPDGLSIGFSDRTSLSVISAAGFAAQSDAGKRAVATDLFNDIFWFDQLGCGSPRALCWLGGDAHSHELFALLQDVGDKKQNAVETGVAISKFVFANEMAAIGAARNVRRVSNQMTVIDAKIHPGLLDNVHGGGVLFQCTFDDIDQLKPLLTRNVQTITHFGLDHDEFQRLAELPDGTGGYRVVPVGQALAFDVIWDGLDLVATFTRKVRIQLAAAGRDLRRGVKHDVPSL